MAQQDVKLEQGMLSKDATSDADMAGAMAALRNALVEDVHVWALECAFKGSFRVDGPSLERYPRYGFGYSLKVQELEGKKRMATARYTSEGKRNSWQMDGMITG